MLVALLPLLLPSRPVAQDDTGGAWTWRVGERWELSGAPGQVLYPAYVADPRRPVFGLTRIDVSESDIEGAGDQRYGVRMGARFGILQLHPDGAPDRGLELAGEVGMLAQFDRDNSTDNLGWDGLYGFHLAWVARPELALRVGVAHDSSHLGDEFIESTGRERLEYTREEVLAGLRYTPFASVSGYLEYGHAYDLRNDELMEDGRVQLGLELQPEPMLWSRRLAPFAALDVSAFEEDDWEENLTLQLGVVRAGSGRLGPWRLGLELYDGRSPIGEFFQERERHLAWGLWLDL